MAPPWWAPARSRTLRRWAMQALAGEVEAWLDFHRPDRDRAALARAMLTALEPKADGLLRWCPAPALAPGQRVTGLWTLDGPAVARALIGAFVAAVGADVPREPAAAELLGEIEALALAQQTATIRARARTVRTCVRCRRGFWPVDRERRCHRCQS